MTRPTRGDGPGRAYLDLQNRARREGRGTQELLTLYVVERWLARLADSRYAEDFVLKGGMLLAAFGQRRPTVDADTLARNLANDADTVVARVAEIAALPGDDGVDFLTGSATATTIRDDALYAGVRVTMDARIATASVKLRLDVSFGDPVTPAPRQVALPALRPGMADVTVLGYPIETVLAEKIVTAVDLGPASTRVRDYADIYSITGAHDLSRSGVRKAIAATARHRGVDLAPLSDRVGAFATLRARTWVAYRHGLGRQGEQLPEELADLVAHVAAFADGVLGESPTDGRWVATSRTWTTTT
jgi:Nucleotidyl transferase AbiEii toxin, Type IV TA system